MGEEEELWLREEKRGIGKFERQRQGSRVVENQDAMPLTQANVDTFPICTFTLQMLHTLKPHLRKQRHNEQNT